MIQIKWRSRCDDDLDVMMIQQSWSSSRDDADPVMKNTKKMKKTKKTKKTKKMKNTWRLRRLEDNEMIQFMQRRRPVLEIVSKEYLPS